MKVFRFGLAAAAGLFLVSCAAPQGSRLENKLGLSEYGHRAGPQGFKTVILDAGHGGKDSGATSQWTGQMEKAAALDTVLRIRQELSGQFKVVLMRDGDYFVELDDRVSRANHFPEAILVSMHYNSGGTNTRGPETFYWRIDSYSLAKRIQREIAAVVPNPQNNRGLVRRRIRLTRNPEIPCVLVEGGYLSHASESRLIADAGYRQQLAVAIAKAIRDQAANGDAGMGPLPPPLHEPMSRPSDARE